MVAGWSNIASTGHVSATHHCSEREAGSASDSRAPPPGPCWRAQVHGPPAASLIANSPGGQTISCGVVLISAQRHAPIVAHARLVPARIAVARQPIAVAGIVDLGHGRQATHSWREDLFPR